MQLRIVHCGLVALDLAFKLRDQRTLCIDQLHRDRLLGAQLFVALQVELGVLILRHVLCQRAPGLVECHLEWPRINARKKVALLHVIAFLERDFDQLPLHTAADGDRGIGGHGAKPAQEDIQILDFRCFDFDRNRRRLAARGSLGRARGFASLIPPVARADDKQNHRQPD